MTDMERAKPSGRSRRRSTILIILSVLAAIGITVALQVDRSSLTRRLSGIFHASSHRFSASTTPYKNTDPSVKYIGDGACLKCHAEIARTYGAHPMGRSTSPVLDANIPANAAIAFEARGLEYSVERRGDRVFHKETRKDVNGRLVSEVEAEARYAVGSGEQAVAFLLERGDGHLFESPITWYSRKEKWDLSPGYEKDNLHFERFIKPTCLFCHSNQFDHQEGTENRYPQPIFHGQAIGCERCHGPGELHAKSPEVATDGVKNIVNPADLEPVLRESVCQQCHLQGDIRVVRAGKKLTDFRPGLPLWSIESVFVNADNIAKTRFFGQTEQMRESRCYQASAGKLGCISCHDPHQLPSQSEKAGYYRDRCMNCHSEKGCGLPLPERAKEGRDDRCIECHMPRSSNEQVPHAATTLHQIPRFKDGTTNAPKGNAESVDGSAPLVHFHWNDLDAEERLEVSRDLGIALATKRQAIPGKTAREVSQIALPVIEKSLEDDPTDAPAWEAKGTVLWQLGRRVESLEAFRSALTLKPNDEATLVAAATREAQLAHRDEALVNIQRAIAINPWRSDYHQLVALLRFEKNEFDLSIDAAKTALQLNPSGLAPRMLLIQSLARKKQMPRAKLEFQALLDQNPPNRDGLEIWFAGIQSGNP